MAEAQLACLVGASYKPGQVVLRLIVSPGMEMIEWVDRDFQPYYLTARIQGELVRKTDLFMMTLRERRRSGSRRLMSEGFAFRSVCRRPSRFPAL